LYRGWYERWSNIYECQENTEGHIRFTAFHALLGPLLGAAIFLNSLLEHRSRAQWPAPLPGPLPERGELGHAGPDRGRIPAFRFHAFSVLEEQWP